MKKIIKCIDIDSAKIRLNNKDVMAIDIRDALGKDFRYSAEKFWS